MAKKKAKKKTKKKVKTQSKKKTSPAKKTKAKSKSTSPSPKIDLSPLTQRLDQLEERLQTIESKLSVLNGVTREYLEEQFSQLSSFDKERKMMVKILDQHESRINSLEGF